MRGHRRPYYMERKKDGVIAAVVPMMLQPRSVEESLRGLAPCQELVRRWALMDVFASCACDKTWKRRISRLLRELQLSEAATAQLVHEANHLAETIRREIHRSGLTV